MLSNLSFTLDRDPRDNRLNVGIDMGHGKWVMDVLDTSTGKHRCHVHHGATNLLETCRKLRELVGTGLDVEVIYEAGRNGFTPARMMERCGANVTVLPVNKLEVLKTGKKRKSDRLDARDLSERDTRAAGFPKVWVPSVEQECRRRMLRESERLSKDIKRNNNRILSILERWPLPGESGHRPAAQWRALLDGWRSSEVVCEFFPETEMACMSNMIEELEALEKNLTQWQQRMSAELDREREQVRGSGQHHVVDLLMQYKGIGEVSPRALHWYVGDFHRFGNGKKFSSYLGLTPVPWQSGSMNRSQGISKSGNPQLRSLMVELAWLWVRYQPDSPITRKWAPHLAKRGRSRKTAIVAVARQLAVALWRFVTQGKELEGAVKNAPLPVPTTSPDRPSAV